jgi:predicted dehydrogenase
MVEDGNLDIIYIATPHSHHYQHARLALEAGKHVLVEKPITVTAEQCWYVWQFLSSFRLVWLTEKM